MSGKSLQVILLIFGLSLALVAASSQANVTDEEIEDKIIDAIDKQLPADNQTLDDATLKAAVNNAVQKVLESEEDEHSKELTKRGWFKKLVKNVKKVISDVATAVTVYKAGVALFGGKRDDEYASELSPEA